MLRGVWRRLTWRSGLQGKLIFSFSLLLMIALTTTSTVFVGKSHSILSDIVGEQARQISQTLAMAAESAYEAKDEAQLKQLGKDLLRSRNIVLVAFFDTTGRPLASACRDPEFNASDWVMFKQLLDNTQQLMKVREEFLPALGDFVQITVPVFNTRATRSLNARKEGPDIALDAGTQLLGYLTVGISKNYEEAQLQRVSWMGVAVGGLVFVICLPLASGLVHRIFLPIRELASAANRIAHGDYDARVATERPDEIGALARSFNEMAHRVKDHQKALQIANESLAEANRDLEEKVVQRTAELESSNRRLSSEIAEKEDFLRAVSHDLNAPLRNIAGMATMLLMKYRERFDDDIIHRLERIQKNVEVETDLIAELLELSRIKTRRQRMEPVDVDVIVRDLAGVFEDDLRRRGIALSVEGTLPLLVCEKARLRQVFQNLIDNAIKYMGERGDGAARDIRVSCRLREDEAAEFAVRDTGIGIDREDLAKVFYVFRRGKNSAEMNVAGKGVGLASVKSIIETYNGRIWVESELGKGSTFRFTIHRKFVPALGGQGIIEPDPSQPADATMTETLNGA
jgi:signal transduction histidine kinase